MHKLGAQPVAAPEETEPLAPFRTKRSDLDLAAQFNDAVGRQTEKLHRAFRIAQHPGEQLLPPDRHAGPGRGEQRLARQEEAGVDHAELRAAGGDPVEPCGNIRCLHEAVAQHDAVETATEILDDQQFAVIDIGHILDLHGQQDDPFVQHLIMFQIVE